MNREEAAEFTRKLVARAETIVFPKTPKTINNIPVFYFEAVLSALRGPQPDPITGLVPCGCGGSAAYHISHDGKNWSTTVKVACNKCLIHVIFSALYELRGEEALADDAKRAWNTAMGWRVEE